MNTIGLIGGMSWESTVTYYQVINRHRHGRRRDSGACRAADSSATRHRERGGSEPASR